MRYRWTVLPTALAIVCSTSGHAQSPSLDDVLQRAGQLLGRYAVESAALLSEERCEQKAFEEHIEAGRVEMGFGGPAMQRIDPRGRRTWRAEFAVVRTPELAATGLPWMEVRDVVEADGQRVPDRPGRLERLLVEADTWSARDARAILDESRRFNLGAIERVVDTPTVALLVLHPANRGRFTFQRAGDEKVGGVRTWKVAFRETRGPTLLHGDQDWGAEGTFWIDPAGGEVLRATIRSSAATGAANLVTVTFKEDAGLRLSLPAEMVTRTELGRYFVEQKCGYAAYRRFERGARFVAEK